MAVAIILLCSGAIPSTSTQCHTCLSRITYLVSYMQYLSRTDFQLVRQLSVVQLAKLALHVQEERQLSNIKNCLRLLSLCNAFGGCLPVLGWSLLVLGSKKPQNKSLQESRMTPEFYPSCMSVPFEGTINTFELFEIAGTQAVNIFAYCKDNGSPCLTQIPDDHPCSARLNIMSLENRQRCKLESV